MIRGEALRWVSGGDYTALLEAHGASTAVHVVNRAESGGRDGAAGGGWTTWEDFVNRLRRLRSVTGLRNTEKDVTEGAYVFTVLMEVSHTRHAHVSEGSVRVQ